MEVSWLYFWGSGNNVYFRLHSVFISLFASASLSLVIIFNCFIYGCKGLSSFQFAQQFSLLSSVVMSLITPSIKHKYV